MFDFLEGKKTYIVGLLFVILGLIQGDPQMVLTGLGFAGLRAGISTTTKEEV